LTLDSCLRTATQSTWPFVFIDRGDLNRQFVNLFKVSIYEIFLCSAVAC